MNKHKKVDTSIAPIKTPKEIQQLKEANLISASILESLYVHVKPGITLRELDRIGRRLIEDNLASVDRVGIQGDVSNLVSLSFLLNDVAFYHPIDDYALKIGDVFGIDCSLKYNGWSGDLAKTWLVGGQGKKNDEHLIKTAFNATWRAIYSMKPGIALNDIAADVENYVKQQKCSMVNFGDISVDVGAGWNHSIGRVHNDGWLYPLYPHPINHGRILQEGMTLSVEPVISLGNGEGEIIDTTTGRMKDRQNVAYVEHVVVITKDGCEVLDLLPFEQKPTYDEIFS